MKKNALAKINVVPVVRDYILTFKQYRGNSYPKGGLFLFFCVPMILGIAMPFLGIVVTDSLSTLLIALYSIFAALFFSFEVFVFEIISKIVDLKLTLKSSDLRLSKFEYISRTIFFSILICLVGSLFLLLIEVFEDNPIAVSVLSGVSFYLFALFILNLLMALKGVHVLLTEEIEIQREAIKKKFE